MWQRLMNWIFGKPSKTEDPLAEYAMPVIEMIRDALKSGNDAKLVAIFDAMTVQATADILGRLNDNEIARIALVIVNQE